MIENKKPNPEVEKLEQERDEIKAKIEKNEADITSMKQLIFTKKAMIKSYEKHLELIEQSIKSLANA